MKSTTCFFPAFGPLLFGRPARSALDVLRQQTHSPNALSQLQAAFGSLIPQRLLDVNPNGGGSRDRLLPTPLTFWAFLAQVLSPGSACRAIVRKLQAWWVTRGITDTSENTSAYCQARARLPDTQIEAIRNDLADRLVRNTPTTALWRGRRVKIVDGTTISMPDTAANQQAYPQQLSQQPGCGFPMMKLVGIFCLASGALLAIARGTLRVHESQLFRQLWPRLQRGDVVLTDRGFCSWAAIAALCVRGVDCVMRLHQARTLDFRCGKPLGHKDRLVQWNKPAQRTTGWSREEWAALPDRLTVRLLEIRVAVKGFRTRRVVLVTTLLDVELYPATALGELYFLRWTVESHFREIKILLGMDVLRCLTPKMIHKELQMHLIAYHLVRVVMQQAAVTHQVPLARLSFQGSLDTMRQWADVLHAAQRQPRKQATLHQAMLEVIARDQLPDRPHRSEPRARKRRPKNYHLLTKPRHQMRVPPHRNRPRRCLS